MGSSKSKNKEDTVCEVIKIALVGTYAVGKTSIVTRYIDDKFEPIYTFTRGGLYRIKVIYVHGSEIRLQVIDTGGQPYQAECIRSLYRSVHGIIVVHDISKPESYDDVDNWLKEINQHCDSKPQIMLIGNKLDLDASITFVDLKGQALKENKSCIYPDIQRISCEDIQKRVSTDETLVNFYCEVSAKTGTNIESVFQIMVREIMYNTNKNDRQMENRRKKSELKRKYGSKFTFPT